MINPGSPVQSIAPQQRVTNTHNPTPTPTHTTTHTRTNTHAHTHTHVHKHLHTHTHTHTHNDIYEVYVQTDAFTIMTQTQKIQTQHSTKLRITPYTQTNMTHKLNEVRRGTPERHQTERL